MTFVQKELLYDKGGDKMEIEIPENKWLKGEFVKDNKIGEITILDEGRPVNGEFGFKVETKIKVEAKIKVKIKDETPLYGCSLLFFRVTMILFISCQIELIICSNFANSSILKYFIRFAYKI